MSREDVMTALFGLLQATIGAKTFGRRLKFATQVPEQPALFLDDRGTEYDQSTTGMLPKRTLSADIWLYTKGGEDPDAVPATILNTMIDAVELALAPDPITNAQSLGGTAMHCWIEGRPEYYSGHLDGQAIAIIPVRILLP